MSGAELVVLAVDDEQPQLEDLARILRASRRVREVETASTASDALLIASRRRYDAVFLDVRMPEIDGLQLARVLRAFASPPEVVYVTAFSDYAVPAFELRALDYLLKPVMPDRVERALERVEVAVTEAGSGADRLSHDGGDGFSAGAAAKVIGVDNSGHGGKRLLSVGSIIYLQAYGDYVRVFTDSGRYLVRGRIADTELRLGADSFLRVHRQYVANLRQVMEVEPLRNGTAVLRFQNASEIPVARRHMNELRRRLYDEFPTSTTNRTAINGAVEARERNGSSA